MAIVLETLSDSKSAQDDLAKLRQSVDGIQASADKSSKSIGSFAKVIGGLIATTAAFKGFTQISDTLTNMESRLKISTNNIKEFNFAFAETARIAITTRSNLSAVSNLYSKTALNAAALGKGQKDIAKFTELVSKATAASGASAQEGAAGIQQLGQALASNNFAGDELRSVLENIPFLAKQIAAGLHVSVGELRAMGTAGQLNAVKVFDSIISKQKEIDSAFSKVGITYASAFTNIGNSFDLIFNAVSKKFSSSGGGLADLINNIAVRLAFVATNFDYILTKIKSRFVGFILDIVIGFDSLWPTLIATGKRISEIITAMYEKWKPTLDAIMSDVKVWVGAVGIVMGGLVANFTQYFSGTALGRAIIDGFTSALSTVTSLSSAVGAKFKTMFPTIDVGKFFPNMKQVEAFVMNFVTKIERGFFWLYDQVIGHSWIPDLVEGVILWTKKLLGSPLNFVMDFVSKSNKGFSKIIFGGGSFLFGLLNIKKHFIGILALVTTIGAIWAGLKFGTPSIKTSVAASKDKLALKSVDFAKKSTDYLKKLNEKFSKTDLGHLTKQVLGMHDSVPGKVNGVNVDTSSEARVPFGPLRLQDNRMFGHDLLNALPKDWQVPVLAGVTAVFSAGIALAFQGGPVRSALLAVFTTVMAVAAVKMIDTATLNKAFYTAANTGLNVIAVGLDALFDGNAAKDPFGVLAIIAKLSLLFKSGREFFGNVAAKTLAAPTNAVRTVADIRDRNTARKTSEAFERKVASYPAAVQKALTENRAAYRKQISDLTALRDRNNNVITAKAAVAAIKSGDTNSFGTAQSQVALQAAINARRAAIKAGTDSANLVRTQAQMAYTSEELKKQVKTLTDRVSDAKQSAKDGVRNTITGAGGIVGGIAGFQVGAEIAKGMTNSPAWAKVGVTMATSFVGQGIGAGIGLTISTILMATASGMAKLIGLAFAATNPFVLGALLVGAAIYAGYELFKALPEEWKKSIKNFVNPLQEGSGVKPVASGLAAAIPGGALVLNVADFMRGETAAAQLLRRDTNKNGGLKGLDTVKSNAKYIGKEAIDRLSGSAMAGEFGGLKLGQINNKSDARGLDTSQYTSTNKNLVDMSTGLVPTKTFDVAVTKTTSGLDKFIEVLKAAFKSLGVVADTPKVPDIAGATGGGGVVGLNTPVYNAPKTLMESLQSAKTLDMSMSMLTDSLNHSGYTSITAKDLAGASIDTTNQIADLASMIQERQGQVDKVGANSYAGRLGLNDISSLKGTLNELIQTSVDNNNLPASVATNLPAGKIKGQETLTLLSQFDTITKTLPGLDLSMEEFRKMTDDLRESIYATAEKINKENTKLTNTPIGTAFKQTKTVGGKTVIGETHDVKASDAFKQIDSEILTATNEINKRLVAVREPFKNIAGDLTKIGVQISESAYNTLSDAQLVTISSLTDGALTALKEYKTPEASAEIKLAAQSIITDAVDKITNQITDSASNGLSSFQALRLDLSSYGVSFDKDMYNRMSDSELEILKGRAKVLKQAGIDSRDKLTEVERKSAVDLKDSTIKAITKSIEDKGFDYKSKMILAGESFASSFTSNISDGFINVIKGKESIKDFVTGALDLFTNNIIDTFIKGLMDPFTKEGGVFSTMLEKLGASVFKDASSIGTSIAGSVGLGGSPAIMTEDPTLAAVTGVTDAINTTSETTNAANAGFFGGLGATFDKGLNWLGGLFNQGLQGLGSLFGGGSSGGGLSIGSLGGLFDGLGTSIGTSIGETFGMTGFSGWLSGLFLADGGMVKGAGTSRSDSIPIMGSNGEFMVNAKATAKHRNLLEAINSGHIPKFASGGFISSGTSVNSASAIVTATGGSTPRTKQVFNINVTGDISRQTRNEIQAMIPQITVGVNQTNRESGHSR